MWNSYVCPLCMIQRSLHIIHAVALIDSSSGDESANSWLYHQVWRASKSDLWVVSSKGWIDNTPYGQVLVWRKSVEHGGGMNQPVIPQLNDVLRMVGWNNCCKQHTITLASHHIHNVESTEGALSGAPRKQDTEALIVPEVIMPDLQNFSLVHLDQE